MSISTPLWIILSTNASKMKRIVPFLILLCLLTSCGTARKVVRSDVNMSDSTAISVVKESLTTTMIDTTKSASGETTIIEIEFFDPATIKDTTSPATPPVITIDGDGIRIDNADNIKSVKATKTKTETVVSGATIEHHEESAKLDSVVVDAMTAEYHEETTPVEPSPGRRIKATILIIVATIIATLIGIWVMKRTGFFGKVTKALSLVSALFK